MKHLIIYFLLLPIVLNSQSIFLTQDTLENNVASVPRFFDLKKDQKNDGFCKFKSINSRKRRKALAEKINGFRNISFLEYLKNGESKKLDFDNTKETAFTRQKHFKRIPIQFVRKDRKKFLMHEMVEHYILNVDWLKVGVEPFIGYISYFKQDFEASLLGVNIYLEPGATMGYLSFKTGFSVSIHPLPIYRVPFQIQFVYPQFRLKPTLAVGYNIIINSPSVYYPLGYISKFDGGLSYEINDLLDISLVYGIEVGGLNIISKYYNRTSVIGSQAIQLGVVFKI